MHRVEPHVFLIGETALTGGLMAYLDHLGTSWRPASAVSSDAERLVEVMGRLCYRSWEPGLNANVTKIREDNQAYLHNIIHSKHGSVLEHPVSHWIFADVSRVFCYHPHTDILTRDGWKSIVDIKPGELLLTKDPRTHLCRWSANKQLHAFPYVGVLYGFTNSEMDSPLMTPDHLLWAARHDLRRARGLQARENVDRYAEKIPFSEIYTKRFVVDHVIKREAFCDHQTLTIGQHTYDAYDLFCWLGWVATDGNFSLDRPNQVKISQSKPHTISRIIALMERLFSGRWHQNGPYAPGKSVFFTISDAALSAFALEHLGPTKLQRHFSEWLCNASTRLLRGFYASALAGDGNVHGSNGHEVLYCTTAHTANQWQIILASMGIASNIRLDSRMGDQHSLGGKMVRTTRPCWVVSVHQRSSTTLVKKSMQYERWYEGEVYCPQTDDGLVFVRKKGLPFWAGNTHELVRHRAGLAFSQESLRYVRLTDLGLWLPDDVAQHTELAQLFEQTFESLEALQLRMADLLDLDTLPFAQKKQWTSAMRRVAPIGLSTTIGLSVNMRALRHIAEMRTSVHAEAEIRCVIDQVMTIARTRWPHIFQDFIRNHHGEWIPQVSKV